MNIILVFESDFISENCVKLYDRRFKHIKNVLKSDIGDILKVGKLNSNIGTGKILEYGDKFITLELNLDENPPKIPNIELILALPRPKVLRRVVEFITVFGVKKVVVINSWRVEKSFWLSPTVNFSSLERTIYQSLEQAKDTVVPEIIFEKRFKPFMEDRAESMFQNYEKYILHPNSEKKLINRDKNRKVVLAIGPEGGFIDYEIDKFEQIGFKKRGIGDRVFKVEQAVAVSCSKMD